MINSYEPVFFLFSRLTTCASVQYLYDILFFHISHKLRPSSLNAQRSFPRL